MRLYLLLASLLSMPAFAGEFVLSIDGLSLAEGERIAGIRIDLPDGRFTAVMNIPVGWWVKVDPPIHARLEMGAVHGAGFLNDAGALKEIARIQSDNKPTVKGTIILYLSYEDKKKELEITDSDIKLTKVDG